MVATAEVYEFGPFRLEVTERRLLHGGRAVPLHDKLFDTLATLVRNPGRLLEKQELMRSVWPDANVEETNLAHNISMIRKVLGDTRAGHPYVETVAKHGYRFVAEVRQIAEPLRVLQPTQAPQIRSTIPPTRYTKAGDVAIAYQVVGDGPVDLVYVPGWITHLEYGWEQPRVAHLFRRLASFSRLILFDKRGTGLSDRGEGYPTLEDRMDDVRAVMDAVRSERAAVFGMSEGGSMSMLFAATYPQRMLALVLYGAFAKRTRSADYPWAPGSEERQRWYELIEQGWGGTTDLDTLAPSLIQDESFCEWWSTYLRLGASPGAAMALARFNTQIDTRDVLPTIQAPTLILHRRGDRDVKIEEGRYLAARIPGATFIELPGDDHLIYAGDVDRLVDDVGRFLSAVQRHREIDRVLSTIVVLRNSAAPGLAAALVEQHCGAHRGRVLQASSGCWTAAFDGPARAIRAACAIVSEAREAGIDVRGGVHTGECELTGNGVYGPPVVVAAGLAAAAPAGAVLVTRTVTELVAGSPLRFESRGEVAVGDADSTWPIYEAMPNRLSIE